MRALLTALLLGVPALARAHEVPARVAVQAFVRPEAQVVRVLVRAPLVAMRDVEFPLRGGVYLDLARADASLRDAATLWIADAITLYANGEALPTGRVVTVRASLPSDGAFTSYAGAAALLRGPPLDTATDIPVAQVMLDVMLEVPLAAPAAVLDIDPRLARLGVRTSSVLTYVPEAGVERVYVYTGDPGRLPLDPRWWHAAFRFVRMGVEHLLDGIDHLLFLLCLIAPVRRLRPLVAIVTAFTVAHSMTLAASAFGYVPDVLWFPPLVEVLIAASIVYMAIENAVGARLAHRWQVAFGFGLVHGFGFSYALRDSLQFAGAHLLTALAAFNVGIELAQLAVLIVAVPILGMIWRRLPSPYMGTVVLSVLIGHTAWHWLLERSATLSAYSLRGAWDLINLPQVLVRLTVGSLLIGGVAWGLGRLLRLVGGDRIDDGDVRQPSPRTAETMSRGVAGMMGVAVCTYALVGAPLPVHAQPRSTRAGVYTADQAKKGKEVFAASCQGCHTVATHTGPAFALKWSGQTLSTFFDYVSRLMPKSAPGSLSEEEYVWVTAYVLKLNGMPASTRELSAEPDLLKTIKIDLPTGTDDAAAQYARASSGTPFRSAHFPSIHPQRRAVLRTAGPFTVGSEKP